MGGCLVLVGRAKDTIVLSSGKNVEPQPIEDACQSLTGVQCVGAFSGRGVVGAGSASAACEECTGGAARFGILVAGGTGASCAAYKADVTPCS